MITLKQSPSYYRTLSHKLHWAGSLTAAEPALTTLAGRFDDGLGPVIDAELLVDVSQVKFDGVGCYPLGNRDFLGGEPCGGGSKHFAPQVEDGSRSVEDLARARGFQVVTSPDSLAAAPIGNTTSIR